MIVIIIIHYCNSYCIVIVYIYIINNNFKYIYILFIGHIDIAGNQRALMPHELMTPPVIELRSITAIERLTGIVSLVGCTHTCLDAKRASFAFCSPRASNTSCQFRVWGFPLRVPARCSNKNGDPSAAFGRTAFGRTASDRAGASSGGMRVCVYQEPPQCSPTCTFTAALSCTSAPRSRCNCLSAFSARCSAIASCSERCASAARSASGEREPLSHDALFWLFLVCVGLHGTLHGILYDTLHGRLHGFDCASASLSSLGYIRA